MNTLVEITADQIAQAGIKKGQRAWSRIKAPAEERRVLWLEIGNALSIGKHQNPSNQGFGKWLTEFGFADIDKDNRSASMWMSQNWEAVSSSGVQNTEHYTPSEHSPLVQRPASHPRKLRSSS
jgi:hypothetical protein